MAQPGRRVNVKVLVIGVLAVLVAWWVVNILIGGAG